MEFMKLFMFLSLLVFVLACEDPQVANNDPIPEKMPIAADTIVQKAAQEIISNAYYCSLITVDEYGVARSRIMEPFPPEENWEIWMATNPKSRKVEQLQNNNQVTLQYFDKNNLGYVSLMGKAYLIHDNSKKEKYWKDEWQAFYANRTNAYLLIKFVPDWMEVISVKHGLNGDADSWEPASSGVE